MTAMLARNQVDFDHLIELLSNQELERLFQATLRHTDWSAVTTEIRREPASPFQTGLYRQIIEALYQKQLYGGSGPTQDPTTPTSADVTGGGVERGHWRACRDQQVPGEAQAALETSGEDMEMVDGESDCEGSEYYAETDSEDDTSEGEISEDEIREEGIGEEVSEEET